MTLTKETINFSDGASGVIVWDKRRPNSFDACLYTRDFHILWHSSHPDTKILRRRLLQAARYHGLKLTPGHSVSHRI